MSPESAIGDVMVQAIPDLAARWDLEVWCPDGPRYRACPVPITAYGQPDERVLHALAAYDLVVYVLGDSWRHSRILPLAQRLPGLVILHDRSITGLVRDTAVEQNQLDALVDRVRLSYGDDEASVMRDPESAGGDIEWLRYCSRVTLSEVALGKSLGVVVHSVWHAQSIDGMLLGDVTVAPMPVPSIRLGFDQGDNQATSVLLDDLPDDDLLLVTVGAVNANRRIDVLLTAIAGDPVLRDRVQLWAVGPVEDRVTLDLLRLAQSLGVHERLRITGSVTDSHLERILARADLAASLRDPVLEGQSASVLTQLLFGIPTVVFDHGHYSELPGEVAIKVDPNEGPAGVGRALRSLVDDGEERVRLGLHARDYVLQSRTGTAYATALLDAGERALAAKPLVYLGADLHTLLARLDLHEEDAVVDTVSSISFELFDFA
jgi:glycosyltransferase involved in cell wall biosynthesis